MKELIHWNQLTILIYMIQSGVVIFSLPRIVAEGFGTNGWLAIIIISIFVVFNIFLISTVYKMSNGKSAFLILESILPKWTLVPVYIALALIWSLLAALVAKNYTLLLQNFTFQSSSPILFMFPLFVMSMLLVNKGIVSITRASTVLFFLTIWTVFTWVFFIPDIELVRYTPYIFQGKKDIVNGSMQVMIAFLGFEVSIWFFPYLQKQTPLFRALFLGNLITTIIYSLVCVVCFGFYSLGQILIAEFPLLYLYAYIQLPFVERIEIFLFSFFALKAFITVVVYYWIAVQALKHVFSSISEQLISLILIGTSFVIMFIPETLQQVQGWLKYLGIIEIAIAFGFPLLMIIGMVIVQHDRRRGKHVY